MSDQDAIDKLRAGLREGLSAEDALLRIEILLRDLPSRPDLWCLRGDLIQLSDGKAFTLQEAEDSYNRALEIDPKCAEAYEGLGYLFDKVYDDPQTARWYFEKAIALGRRASRQALKDVLEQMRDANQGEDPA